MAPDSLDHGSSPTVLDIAHALIARWRASASPRVLFVGHAMGGGVRRHMDDLAALLATECRVVWARPGPGATLEIHARDESSAESAAAEVLAAYELGEEPPRPRSIVLDTLG